MTTGRLKVLGRILAAHGDDLMDGTQAEREVSVLLNAVHTAISLEATAELAQLVKPWMSRKLMDDLRAMQMDDADRENAIASLARDVEAQP